MRTGVAFRPELAVWLASHPRDIECIELRVDRAIAGLRLSRAQESDPRHVVLNAPRLAVGGLEAPSPADLCDALRAACVVDAVWISAHLGDRRRPEDDFGYPDPLTLNGATLARVIGNCLRITDTCQRPLLVENVAAFCRGGGSMSEADFINKLCDETGCGVLLDVTTLTLDARHGLDPRQWLGSVDPHHIVALRLGGWREHGRGHWAGRREGHVPTEAWALAREVAAYAPVQAAILQSDGRFLGVTEMQAELRRLAALASVSDDQPGLDRVFDAGQVGWRHEPARL
jgi:uncharacterized protein